MRRSDDRVPVDSPSQARAKPTGTEPRDSDSMNRPRCIFARRAGIALLFMLRGLSLALWRHNRRNPLALRASFRRRGQPNAWTDRNVLCKEALRSWWPCGGSAGRWRPGSPHLLPSPVGRDFTRGVGFAHRRRLQPKPNKACAVSCLPPAGNVPWIPVGKNPPAFLGIPIDMIRRNL